MLDYLSFLDTTLFLFVNVTLSNPVTNWLMPIVTSDNLLRILFAVSMLLLLWKGDTRMRWLVLFAIVTVAIADQVSSNFLKHLIARTRPCHTLTNINLLVGCGGGYSMPSSHAANAFAVATLFAIHVRQAKYYLYIFAGLIAVSRVFVGVHYPFDVLVGVIVGTMIGIAVAYGFTIFYARIRKRKRIGKQV